MKRRVLVVFVVCLLEVGIVTGYVLEWIPLHPIVIMLPLVGFINFKVEGKGCEGLGLVLTGLTRPVLLVLAFTALSVVEHIIRLQLEGISLQRVSFNMKAIDSLIKSLLIDMFIIALWEETVSRGYIQTRLQKTWGLLGVVIATVLFAVLHLPTTFVSDAFPNAALRFFQTGLSGFMLGYLYWKSMSVLPTILLHGLWNFAGSFIVFLSGLSYTHLIGIQVPFQLGWSLLETVLMVLACNFIIARNDPVLGLGGGT